ELSLRKGSLMLQRWSNVELPIYLSVYLFEVTNPDEAEFKKAKPILKERGPYVFLEKRYKEILGFEEDESLIIYKEFTSFYFDRSRSVGSLDDEIMVLNIPVVAAINHAINEANFTDLGYVFIDILKATVDSLDEKLFEIHTIGEMLFTGYRVALFDKLTTMAKEFDMETEEKLANNTFGLLIKKNGTDSGIWKVQTGLEGDAFVVKTWNHSSYVPFWNGDYCNKIRGTDGSSFHPGIEKDEVLHIFHPDICRSAFLEYDTEASIYDVSTYRFIIPDKVFAAPSKYSNNACFCTRREHDRHVCTIDGIQDMSACADGAPIITSSPHFYGADPKLMKDVEGLTPEKSKHQAYVDIEPTTGAVVNAARRMQVNVEIKNSQEFPILSNVRNMILPVMWIQEVKFVIFYLLNQNFNHRVPELTKKWPMNSRI
ncbi:platelet glycoprotein 4-like protein, partial [Leptotrombidium deliense]